MKLGITMSGHEEIKRLLEQLGENAADAARMSMNRIGENMQYAMRAQLPKRFSLRGTQSAFSSAIVLEKASKGKMTTVGGLGSLISIQKRTGVREVATLKVGSDQGGTKATATRNLGVLLARHEEAETRTSSNVVRLTTGETKNVGFFIPARGLRTSSTNIPRNLYPKAVGATQVRRTDGSYGYNSSVKKTRKVKGQQQIGATFIVNEEGIFRWKHDFSGYTNRHGRKITDRAEPIWWFSKRVRTPARLRLWETAQTVFDRFAVAYVMDAVDTVIARGGR